MRWRGRRQSSNIEDRRGGGFAGFGGGRRRSGIPLRLSGGSGVFLIIAALILWLGFGVNPMQLLGMLEGGGYQQPVASGPGVRGTSSETDDFVATVLADTEDVWRRRFQAAGSTYPEPTLVLFDGRVQSACGLAGAATGPFYCPGDSRLYIDLSFFQKLRSQLGAPGDFAQAYVVAHEVGHHIQNVTGVLPAFNEARRRLSKSEANALSVRVELQADCYAGIWAHDTDRSGYLERGDLDEALNAAEQIGDDTLQQRSQGVVVPDSFTHGTSAQRKEWFYRGYDSGDVSACDTLQGVL